MKNAHHKVIVEQTAVDLEILNEFHIELLSIENSCNNWLDLTISGTKENLMKYLERIGVDEQDLEMYFEDNVI